MAKTNKSRDHNPGRKRMKDVPAEALGKRLRALRLACELTQTELGRAMGCRSDNITRLETRDDMYVSSLVQYVRSCGAEVELVAVFGGRRFKLKAFG